MNSEEWRDVAPDDVDSALRATFDWAHLQPGDVDPEADVPPVADTCGATMPGRPWRCTRSVHADPAHVASGTRGIVIASWGPTWGRELTRGQL